jgi:hypothetical protein
VWVSFLLKFIGCFLGLNSVGSKNGHGAEPVGEVGITCEIVAGFLGCVFTHSGGVAQPI